MLKPACRLGDQANCPADSHGNGGGSMRAALATLALFLLLLQPCTGLAADAAQQEIGYTSRPLKTDFTQFQSVCLPCVYIPIETYEGQKITYGPQPASIS